MGDVMGVAEIIESMRSKQARGQPHSGQTKPSDHRVAAR
jgi:hypothetical protein